MKVLLEAQERIKAKNLLEGVIDHEPVRAEDKRVINGKSDVNQLIPLKYHYAWQKYLDASSNHWMPQEVSMQKDIAQWHSETALTSDERHIIETALGFFSTADTMVANNLVIAIYERITSPEHRQYLLIQAKEEGIHTHAYQYCIESLSMEQERVFNQYREVPEMAAKMAWAGRHTKALGDKNATDSEFLENLIAFYVVFEGIFFYCGFPQVLSLGRRNLMGGIAEQFQYILRDESMHLNFGIDLINEIKNENPHLWTAEFQQKAKNLILEGYLLERDFAKMTLPRGVLGMNFEMQDDYLKFITNRRLVQIGLPEIQDWSHIQNPLPWMSEMMDLRKEKNFFETRVTDYQVGTGLNFDDEPQTETKSLLAWD